MLYRELNAVYSQIHTKPINTLCGHNVELLNVKLVLHTITTGSYTANHVSQFFKLVFPNFTYRLAYMYLRQVKSECQ